MWQVTNIYYSISKYAKELLDFFFFFFLQKINLYTHLRRVEEDIAKAIPDRRFNGLAILDIEEWRPLWSSNWGAKQLYLHESIKFVFQRYPNISLKGAEEIAIGEFNEAAA